MGIRSHESVEILREERRRALGHLLLILTIRVRMNHSNEALPPTHVAIIWSERVPISIAAVATNVVAAATVLDDVAALLLLG